MRSICVAALVLIAVAVGTAEAQSWVRRRTPPPTGEHESTMPLGNVVFGELSWRAMVDPSGRVPTPQPPDELTGFAALGKVLRLRGGALVKHVFVSGAYEAYYGGSRDGTSPNTIQVEVGWGKSLRYWSKGGPMKFAHTRVRCYDRFGNFLYELKGGIEVPENARGPCEISKAETTNEYVEIPPGWVKAWYAGYAGYRHIGDFLGGDAAQTDPLVSGGGPVVGATAYFLRFPFTFALSHEFVYYVHGWDDHGHFGWTGRLAFGVPLFLMELTGRLDPGVGKEFMFGASIRYDRF